MDECESFRSTPDDREFLNEFVEAMSKIYDAEKDRQTAILELFVTAGIGSRHKPLCCLLDEVEVKVV
jgi:hypothetical protein